MRFSFILASSCTISGLATSREKDRRPGGRSQTCGFGGICTQTVAWACKTMYIFNVVHTRTFSMVSLYTFSTLLYDTLHNILVAVSSRDICPFNTSFINTLIYCIFKWEHHVKLQNIVIAISVHKSHIIVHNTLKILYWNIFWSLKGA